MILKDIVDNKHIFLQPLFIDNPKGQYIYESNPKFLSLLDYEVQEIRTYESACDGPSGTYIILKKFEGATKEEK